MEFREYNQYMAKHMRLYSQMDFNPNCKDPNVFNLFTGYKARLLKTFDSKKFRRIQNHIWKIICKKNMAKYTYLMQWIAHVLQHPGDRTGVVLFLQSEKQGSGKNTVFDFISKYVIGENYSREIIGLGPLLEKHNTVLLGAKFMMINEARDNGGSFLTNFDKLKSLITESTVWINPKNKDPFKGKNFLEIAISSQHENSLHIEESDRRYFCLDVDESRVGDKKYFTKLYKSFTDEAGSHFLTYATQAFGSKRVGVPVMTSLKEKMIQMSLPNPVKFIYDLMDKALDMNIESNIHLDAENMKVSGSELYRMYEHWCDIERETNKYKLKSFEMKILSKIKYLKQTENRKVVYDLSQFREFHRPKWMSSNVVGT
jgi:phage/plasmid-associated DNA primase